MTAICALVGLCHFYPRVDAIIEQPRCGWKSAVSRNQRCSRLGSEVRMEKKLFIFRVTLVHLTNTTNAARQMSTLEIMASASFPFTKDVGLQRLAILSATSFPCAETREWLSPPGER